MARDADARTIAVVLTAVGVVRVAIAIVFGERFGAEATIAAIMIVLGLASLRST
jgi:hypothetical protein